MKKQSGFTLIELVVVLIVIGLLAVTAIPKFIDFTDQAKQANIEGMAGGFATGISLVRAQWEVEGRPQNTSGQNAVNYEGTLMILTTESSDGSVRPGYAVGLSDGENLDGAFDVTNCVEVWTNLLQNPPLVAGDIAELNSSDRFKYLVSQSGGGSGALCHYHLKETLNKDANNNYVAPSNLTGEGNSFTYQPANSAVVVYINN
ncbi:prepilin-type N-terminal cleavage/methylation domain-containing protein [Thalassotalea agarivorans]|uniref:MSHA pilin protein MshB n=1 Tax=Thalassotalea agarivorans TaxID=349064 RepID=A0A1I0G0F3_THASX|nr:prepilin-type N-terminal cleavage/methylation domain-containing protein [Thalassotalea agarivorans]SET64059.1 MSHA pilin protein MshB [Thalassotalea agarivorans]